jgi:hypothetical protein
MNKLFDFFSYHPKLTLASGILAFSFFAALVSLSFMVTR